MEDNLDGPLIVQWARRAAAGLREKQTEINSLNVFPIPDSDTGSNMAHTMSAAYASSQEVDEENVVELTAALAGGAVRGARGNSGVVLSQVLRSLADTAARGPVNGEAIAAMLGQAVEFVKNSIASPVEGTVLTVLRAAADGAHESRATLRDVVDRALVAAEEALKKTPEQLPALAKAGVVDAGGRGLVVILQALQDVLTSSDATGEPDVEESAPDAPELEVMFFFTGSTEDMATLNSYLRKHGSSVAIARADERSATVHVHTTSAGQVIEKAFALGQVTDLRLEVLPDAEDDTRVVHPILVLVPNPSAADIFEGAGTVAVQPDAEQHEFERALRRLEHGPVAILTNGFDPSRLLSSGVVDTGAVDVIDTHSLVGGLAAIAVHNDTSDWEDDLADMADAVSAQRWENTDIEHLPQALSGLLATGGELVTILWDHTDGEADLDRLRESHPHVEIDAYQVEGLIPRVQVGVE